MALTLNPGERAEAFDNFLDILLDAWIVEFVVQCATAQFGASEKHCDRCHLHTQVQKQFSCPPKCA